MTRQTGQRGAGARALPLADAARRLGGRLDDTVRQAARRLPLRFPAEYVSLADPDDPHDPIRAIGWPHAEELADDPGALPDPVGEQGRVRHPLVIQKHENRVILVVTKRCHFYCRFCFRAGFPAEPGPEELEQAIASLAGDARLREVILSGGDPLTLSDDRLADILDRLARIPSLETLRIHTRAPVHDPARITPSLVGSLRAASPLPLWIVTHATHPRELRPGFDEAVARLVDAGIPVFDQTVLLGGVNAEPAVLAELFAGLYRRRVKPYYLHHPDRIAGTARFRVTLAGGRRIYRELRERLPGPALPAYVIDLPDGTGKVPVMEMTPEPDGTWSYEHAGGRSIYDDKAVSMFASRKA